MAVRFLFLPAAILACIHVVLGMAAFWPVVWAKDFFLSATGLLMEIFLSATGAAWAVLHRPKIFMHLDSGKAGAAAASAAVDDDWPAMIVSANHRTRLDWLFLWSILPSVMKTVAPDIERTMPLSWPFGILSHLIVVLKRDIERIPFMGWGAAQGSFIFLDRDWAKDERSLRDQVTDLVRSGRRPVILVFAEGTDLSTKNLNRSITYARDKGLAPRFSTLFPRKRGLQAIAEAAVEAAAGRRVPVIDITIDYTGGVPQSEVALAAGKGADAVEVWVQRRDMVPAGGAAKPGARPAPFSALCSPGPDSSGNVEATEAGVSAWLDDSFLWREATLGAWKRASSAPDAAARCTDATPEEAAAVFAPDPRCEAWAAEEAGRDRVETAPMLATIGRGGAAGLALALGHIAFAVWWPLAAGLWVAGVVGGQIAVLSLGGWRAVVKRAWGQGGAAGAAKAD